MHDAISQSVEDLLARGQVIAAMETLKHFPKSAMNAPLAALLLKHARTWHTAGLLTQQREICELILRSFPENHEALHLLGFHAQTSGDFTLAENYYSRALACDSAAAFSQLALAQMRMMRSGFQEGRELYEARFDAVTEANGPDWRGLPIARWKGEPLNGKSIYLWAEQGLGDIVMFAGFLPFIIRQRPARIVLGVPAKLMALFTRSFPGVHIESLDDAALHALGPAAMTAFPQIEKLAALKHASFSLQPLRAAYHYVTAHGLFDCTAPMGDLMVYCMPDAIPARHQKSYLTADADRTEKIVQRLAHAGSGRRIGIAWHTTNRSEAQRNIALEQWLGVLAVQGCHFISLQHQVEGNEIQDFCRRNGCRITVLEDMDFATDAEGLFALVAAMDEIITIDNSTAHIAGALGIPTSLLLPLGCNYRWPVMEGNRTLWYASVKTCRQTLLSDWNEIMASTAEALHRRTMSQAAT